jgi:hypothetical protein
MPVEDIQAEIVTIQESTSSWIAQFNGTWLSAGLALLIVGGCLGAALLVHRAVWRSVATRLPRPSARGLHNAPSPSHPPCRWVGWIDPGLLRSAL